MLCRHGPHTHYNHSAASSKNLSNSSSSWKQSISPPEITGETEIGFISSTLRVESKDKDVHGSGWRASSEDERTEAGNDSSCVAPVIFTAGMILMVTNPPKR